MEKEMNKERIVACCGLICSECPSYLATKANDPAKIAETAKMWSEQFNVNIPPESVWCEGCNEEGRKCGHCGECEVRSCARSKQLANCGLCPEMDTCATIQNFIKMAPQAGETLRAMR